MRCNWRRWLWGLIPLLVVCGVAVYVERGRIEQDLSARARQLLAAEGLGWANVKFEGRDMTLAGGAVLDSEPARAEAALRKLWGVRDVENRASLPPKVEPFTWAARRRGTRVRLSGYVSDRATRRTVLGLAKAALPGFEVVDRMNVARGIPPADTWLAGLSFALQQLASLKKGDVRFNDLALTISGEAEDAAGYRSVSTALKTGLPKGITLAGAQIMPPVVSPFTWSAQFAGRQLVLSGYVAGEAARAEMLAAAKAAASADVNLVDRMEVAEGAPSGWSGVAAGVARELVRLESGTAEMKDAAVAFAGLAADEAQGQQARSGLKVAVTSPFRLSEQIKVREPPPKPEPQPPAEPVPSAPEARKAEPAAPLAAETPPPKAPEADAKPPAPALRPEAEAPKTTATAPPVADPPAKAPPAPPPAADAPPKVAAPAPAPVEPPGKIAAAAPQAAELPKVPAAEPPKAPAAEPPAAVAPKVAATPPKAEPPALATCQARLGKAVGAAPILFDTNSATLDAATQEALNQVAAVAKACPGARIAVEGHADIEGSAQHNQRLSARRAEAVVAHLIKAGASARQLEAVGLGASRPVAPNDTVENKARNRRIEFVIRQP